MSTCYLIVGTPWPGAFARITKGGFLTASPVSTLVARRLGHAAFARLLLSAKAQKFVRDLIVFTTPPTGFAAGPITLVNWSSRHAKIWGGYTVTLPSAPGCFWLDRASNRW